MEEIEKCYNVMGIAFDENEIDRAHGIGRTFLDEERKKKVRSIIVKFKPWKVRAAFYKARFYFTITLIAKMNLIIFYKIVSLCSVKT